MSQSPRPVYTKSRTTKRPRPGGGGSSFRRPSRTPGRFHGAFTGGHSAGYYNTVGTEDGWKPSNEDDYDDDAIGATNRSAGHDDAAAAELGVAINSASSNIDEKQQSASTFDAGGNGSSKKRPRVWDKNRSAADYMDDRDYDEWAGPTGISSEYAPATNNVDGGNVRKPAVLEKKSEDGGLGLVPSELLEPVTGLADAIGRKLLRRLGWRGNANGDTSSAYVPTHVDTGGYGSSNENTQASSNEMLLSKKRLRKIQLSERGHSLPPPKIDTYGLGYDPFKNAPEFAAHRETRRQRAEERARAAGGGYGGRYHTSDLLDDEEDGEDDGGGEANANRASRRARAAPGGYKEEKNSKSNVLAYETAEDFVGKTGVGGFALHDDEDDVYDSIQADGRSEAGIGKGQRLVGIGGEEYHRELIDHGDSDVEEHCGISLGDTAQRGSNEFQGALNAWAKGDASGNSAASTTAASSAPAKAVTSDGRRPLDGFVLGGSGGERDVTNKRWPGPDLPPNYVPVKHVFREEDLPERVAEKSRNVRLEAEHSRKANAGAPVSVETQPHVAGLPAKRDDDKPMAGTAFAGLAVTMKDRFTSGSGESDAKTELVQFGLHVPAAKANGCEGETQSGNVDVSDKSPAKEVKEITVKRSVMLWNPDPLLCKRFGVRPPRPAGSLSAHSAMQSQQQPTEHSYFQKEILGAVQASRTSTAINEDRPTAKVNGTNPNDADDVDTGNNDFSIQPPHPEDDIGGSRPPMDLFKSIFGSKSSDSDDVSSSEEEVDGPSRTSDIAVESDKDDDKKPAQQKETVHLLGNELDSLQNARKDYVAAASFGFADTDRRRRSDALDTASSSSSSSYERHRRRKKKKKKRRKYDSRKSDDSRRRSKDSRRRKRKKDSGSSNKRRRSRNDEQKGGGKDAGTLRSSS